MSLMVALYTYRLNMPEKIRIKHLYARAGFGIPVADWEKSMKLPLEKHIDHLLSKAAAKPSSLSISAPSSALSKPRQQFTETERKENQESIKQLNLNWLEKMGQNENPILERMTFFWHDHFACRIRFYPTLVQHIQTIRTHATTNFRELLLAVSKDPGMIRFLNNQQNKKEHPNENFARELLELFTLGRGNYTEKDIKEAARAFTGWSSNLHGEFVFRRVWHDTGKKEFMGKRGNFSGEDILNMVLDNRQTAYYITEKLYKYFVHPIPNNEIVQSWAKNWYESDYDILSLVEEIIRSDHFYEDVNISVKIKSPIEYLVSMMQLLELTFEAPQPALMIQKVLGQMLFVPPNVSGWPEGTAWIDSSTLLARLNIPKALIYGGQLNLRPKKHFSSNEDPIAVSQSPFGQTATNLEPVFHIIKGLEGEQVVGKLADLCLIHPPDYLTAEEIHKFIPGSDRATQVKGCLARIMGTPEFQLC